MPTIEIQFDKQFDNSRVIRDVDLRCRADYICVTLLGAMFVLGVFCYGWQQYQWIQYGIQIEEAQGRIDELTETARTLRIERQRLAAPQRIDQIARGDLGMVSAGPDQYVPLEPGFFDRTQPPAPATQYALREEGPSLGP